jgi:hypothetical protein
MCPLPINGADKSEFPPQEAGKVAFGPRLMQPRPSRARSLVPAASCVLPSFFQRDAASSGAAAAMFC